MKKKTPAEELIESLLQDVGGDESLESGEEGLQLKDGDDEGGALQLEGVGEESEEMDQADINEFLGGVRNEPGGFMMTSDKTEFTERTENEYERTRQTSAEGKLDPVPEVDLPKVPTGQVVAQNLSKKAVEEKRGNEDKTELFVSNETKGLTANEAKTELVKFDIPTPNIKAVENFGGDGEKTVAVAGYQTRNSDDYDDRVKVSVGQNRGANSGYAVWNSGGSAESNLAQADNLRMAQEKILDLESENEKLRLQNEELMAASEIIKERSDLLSAQLSEYKNDRDSLEDSFKNEIVLLKNHLSKKDNELQKAQLKTDELESRLKFDMKKIRVRERELENRLELIRAEKNAIVKNKDEQILDLRRKMDVLQMEVESYRQKCVDLNKSLETNQESFKRTTRALRLAMANLELQEENKATMKKAE
ncbi:MAG: hypothetical protein ACXVAX_00100 [Pseudobdellovibrio sp.]